MIREIIDALDEAQRKVAYLNCRHYGTVASEAQRERVGALRARQALKRAYVDGIQVVMRLLFANANARWVVLGHGISMMGDAFSLVAVPMLLMELTGRPASVLSHK